MHGENLITNSVLSVAPWFKRVLYPFTLQLMQNLSCLLLAFAAWAASRRRWDNVTCVFVVSI